MAHRFYILDAELRSDVLARGYASMTREQIVESLNAVDRSAPAVTRISSAALYEAIDRDEWLALTSEQRDELNVILGLYNIDIEQGSKARAALLAMFTTGAAPLTRQALVAVVQRQQSRAAEIGLPGPVKWGWVDDVLRKGGAL